MAQSAFGETGSLARTVGWTYFALICLLAIAAPVLFVATNGGS